MSQNIPKKVNTKRRSQPTRDIETIMEKSRNNTVMSNEEGLESEEERINYIQEDNGL